MSTQAKYTLLYVDDEESNLRAFKASFFWYYQVVTANSAQAALDVLAQQPVQMVISDQRMPGITGIELLEQVSTLYPDVVTLILSGFGDTETLMEAINRTRIFRFVAKPWQEDELRQAIDQGLEFWQLRHDKARLIDELQQINRNLEWRIEERTREITAIADQKERLIQVMSHDLRSPISVILGLLNLLRANALSPEKLEKFAGDISYSLKNLMLLLDNLLQWSTAGTQVRLQKQPLGLVSDILQQNIALLGELGKAKNLSLDVDLPQDSAWVMVDTNLVQFVVRNLLHNAIKFTPENGHVRLGTYVTPEHLVLQVSDSGVGIAPERLAKFLDRQGIAATSGTKNEKGTGLGLPLIQEFIEKMGGYLEAQSTPGEGSTFRVFLPRLSDN